MLGLSAIAGAVNGRKMDIFIFLIKIFLLDLGMQCVWHRRNVRVSMITIIFTVIRLE